MDRTLFTPAMIETYRACKRAYQLAFVAPSNGCAKGRQKLSNLCKRFLVKAIAEINRGRVRNMPEVQKFLGQHWPSEEFSGGDSPDIQEKAIQAFRFAYRVLANYVNRPYRPGRAETAAVNLKVRARIPHTRVYLEDTLDLILWHPEKKVLEFVDYHLQPLRPFDPAWPSASLLIKHFLAQRLRARWAFDKVVVTFYKLQPEGASIHTVELDESLYNVHWPELVRTVEEMKNPIDLEAHAADDCRRCESLGAWVQAESSRHESMSLSA